MERSNTLISQNEDSEKLELFVSCRNLDNLDILTVTDSYLVVTITEPNKPPKKILKTKVYYNDLNPNYTESLLIDFVFQIQQKLTFQVFHEANPPAFVGKMQTRVGEIFGSPEHGLIRDLMNNSNKKSGKIIVRCQKQDDGSKKQITFKLCAKNLPDLKNWWFFGGTSSFFRIVRKRKNDELIIYESETVNFSTSPTFKELKITQSKLNKKQEDKQIEIRFYNYSNMGNHEFIGSTNFSMVALKNKKQYKIFNGKKQNGVVVFENVKVAIEYSFIDYIKANLQLSLVTCIDFTASNGTPNKPESLHYFDHRTKSHYEKALQEVSTILMDYDYDKLVPVYGFGAKVEHPKLSSKNKVHHCFPINGNIENPSLYGVDEIMKSYRNILKYITFSGPTYFSELLKQAISECKKFQKAHNQYMVLFIITDGQIHDREQVIDMIIECNRLPISIIIVGVGNSDFTIMHQLDDDNCQMTSSKGQKTQRDLVQFVQFKQHNNNSVQLARQVLQQLPRQVSEYYKLMGLTPNEIKINQKNGQSDIEKILKNIKLSEQNPESKVNA